MRSNLNDITLELEIKRMSKSQLAILITDGKTNAWLPISQIEYDENEIGTGNATEIILSEWLAENKGLI